jgi:hypothetical protein
LRSIVYSQRVLRWMQDRGAMTVAAAGLAIALAAV